MKYITKAPWLGLYPGIALVLATLGFMQLGLPLSHFNMGFTGPAAVPDAVEHQRHAGFPALRVVIPGEGGAPEDRVTTIICQMLVNALVILGKQRVGISAGAPEWLSQVLRRIHSPEYIACQASDIYRLSGYSPPVVIHCFRQYTGETVVSYLTRTKMDSARRLLSSTDLTVLDIAGRLGYGSVSHFNKLFRAAAGMSPGEYRRRYRRME